MYVEMKLGALLISFIFAGTARANFLGLPDTLLGVAASNLRFIKAEQLAQNRGIYLRGEFPTHIHSTLVPEIVGVGRPLGFDEEASAFTTGSIVNRLATIYLEHPELLTEPAIKNEMTGIPQMIELAVGSFARYREGDLFNFYPPKMWKGHSVRQPGAMTLFGIWKGFTNIPEDADTTSVTYAALLFDAKIRGEAYSIPEAALESLSHHRDVGRRANIYNRLKHLTKTGAFLTWQFDENNPAMPHFYFSPPEKGTRIPFNRNDVDCIVNLNVLRMLALNGSVATAGRKEACAMVNEIIRRNDEATCGMYYPNTLNLGFSVAQVEKAGGACLQPQRQIQLTEYVLTLQKADGGWVNDKNIWPDRVQSTAFAMETLLKLGNLKDRRIVSSLMYGTAFLLRSRNISREGHIFWNGQEFFTATFVARSLISWRSHSFTTATVTSVLLEMQRLFPRYKVDDYLKIN